MSILNVEGFIRLVQSHPILYDVSILDYKDKRKKDDVWTNIAAICGLDNINEAKKKWKALRNCMSRYKKMQQDGKVQRHTKPYKYAQLLGFLLPHLVERDSFGYFEEGDELYVLKEEVHTPTSEPPNADDLRNALDETADIDDHVEDSESTFSCSQSMNSELSTTIPTGNFTTSPTTMKRVALPRKRKLPLPVQTLPSYVGDSSEKDDSDDLTMFMKAMASMIRRLPAHAQCDVKFGIHRLVYQAEREVLQTDNESREMRDETRIYGEPIISTSDKKQNNG